MEISAEGIHKAYGPRVVIDDASFTLTRGQKAGLVGYNGTGKSTLLQILAGVVEPDGGAVQTRSGALIGYMPQDTSLVTDETVGDYVRRVTGIGELEKQMEISADAAETYALRNGYTFDYRLGVMLTGFGLVDVSTDRPINTLSSGQKSKVFMAGVLLAEPDVLLLDEPTNNLDLPALIWLEDYLQRCDAACLIVSHDRLFLDRVVRTILELDWHSRTVSEERGCYTDYLRRKEQAADRQRVAHEAQQEEIGRLSEQVRERQQRSAQGSRYVGSDNDKFGRGAKRDRAGRSGKAAMALERRIEQMDVVVKPVERDVFRIQLEPTPPKGGRVIELEGVVAGYPSGTLRIGPLSLVLPYGSRTVLMGLNGTGKSTLLRTIGGDLQPVSGQVKVGSALVVGNLTQEHDNLPRDEQMGDYLTERAGIARQDAHHLAAQFGFESDELQKELGSFSPGGRARLLLALFTALQVNVLLLDEPTNHLDLEALEALEAVVQQYEGTIVLVSHDRMFLERFKATDIYVIEDGKLRREPGLEAYIAAADRAARQLMDQL